MKSHLPAGRALAVVSACLLIAAGGGRPASADACTSSALGCADQAVGQVLATATDAPSGPGATSGTVATVVDATTDQAADAVTDAGDAVPAPVDAVTDPVVDDVAAVLRASGSSVPAPRPGDGTGSSGGGGAPGGSTTPRGANASSPPSSPSHHPRGRHVAIGRIGIAQIAASRGMAVSATSSVAAWEAIRSIRQELPPERGATVGAVARALRFPILLLVAILLFVMFQQRVDRKAPKLVLASIDSREETLTFG
jgi:hypothetical protein